MKKKITGLYVITDNVLVPNRSHFDVAKAAILGGAKIIQMRDKLADDRKFYLEAVKLRELCKNANVVFIVNDRVHIASAVDADGVHIGETELPLEAARVVLGMDKIVGVSADNLEQALAAEQNGADYIGFGPIFQTTTKADAGPETGLENLAEICSKIHIPVVAIGGINLSNIEQVLATGVDCVSVISAIVTAEDMISATAEFVKFFKK
ncbi:MAG: thiamine phosphate synthase [Armatimonadota bacterium]